MAKKKPQLKKIPDHIQRIAATISAVGVVCATLGGIGHWIISEVSATTNSRIDKIEQKIDENQLNNELATMRLELMTLISHDPDNVIEIEKLAKKYFNPPYNGDTYMTSVISRWCEEKNINCGEIMIK